MMKLLLFLLLPCWLLATEAPNPNGFKGYVKVREDRELYVDWSYAKAGQPTVVLLNGVTYSTEQWSRFAQQLIDQGIGVLRFDPRGMGKTLLLHAPVMADIKIEDQARDMHDLLEILKVPKPLNLIGLSYGGGLAFFYASVYPQEVGNLIALAPYTEPIKAQNDWILAQIWYTRQVEPWNIASDDDLYAFFFRQVVYSTYPLAEPISIENPFKLEGILRMGLGIRKFHASEVVSLFPAKSLHLVIAGRDHVIPRAVLEDFWSKVPASVRATKLIIGNSGHKVPEDVPKFSASWVMEILKGGPVIRQNVDFEGDPYTGVVKYNGGEIKLKAE